MATKTSTAVHSTPSRPRAIVLLLLLMGTGIFAWYALHPGNGPELLLRYTPSLAIGQPGIAPPILRHDHLYWHATTNEDTLTIYSRPLREGKETILYQEKIGNVTVAGSVFTENEALFLLMPRVRTSYKVLSGPNRYIGKDGKEVYIDSPYWRDEKRPATASSDHREVVPRPVLRNMPPPVLLRIPLQATGAAPNVTHTPLDVEGYLPERYALTAAGLYWVRPDTTTVTRVFPADIQYAPHLEMAPQDTLMFTPIGGKPQILKRGCLIEDMANYEGVVRFSEMRAFLKSILLRYELAGATPSPPVRLPVPPGVMRAWPGVVPRAGAPIEYSSDGTSTMRAGDRYYWLEWQTMAAGAPQTLRGIPSYFQQDSPLVSPAQLWSERPDGTDARLIAELRDVDGEIITPDRLFSDGGRLYLIFSRFEGQNGSPKQKRNIYLTRLNTGQRDAPLAGKSLLSQGYLSFLTEPVREGYLYFVTGESHVDPLDFLHRDITMGRSVSYYGIKLPSTK